MNEVEKGYEDYNRDTNAEMEDLAKAIEVNKAEPKHIDREKALADVVSQIEQEYLDLERRSQRLGLNQPVITAVSSISSTNETNTQDWNDQIGYSEFNVKLPFPALKVQSLQLHSANIPQANTNIPNTAIVFWYYRLNGYTGQSPNTDNLYQIRLLPSYYKQELLNTPDLYGYNQTFKTYSNLNTSLALSVANDPAYDSWKTYSGIQTYTIPFLPNEISFDYNKTTNRFSMTGTNATTELCYRQYDPETSYALNEVICLAPLSQTPNFTFVSLENDNLGNSPTSSPLFWKQIYVPVIQEWSSLAVYNSNAITTYGDLPYQSLFRNTNQRPDGDYAFDVNYYYSRWQVVEYGGTLYTYINVASTNYAIPPDYPAIWQTTDWDGSRTFTAGFICYFAPYFYEAIKTNTNQQPTINTNQYWSLIGTNFWKVIGDEGVTNRYLITGANDPNVALKQGTTQRQYNPYNLYEVGEAVYYKGTKYTALFQNQNQIPFIVPSGTVSFVPTQQYTIGDIVFSDTTSYICIKIPPVASYPSKLSQYWSNRVWANDDNAVVPIVSLSTISKKFDFWDADLQLTFPIGIPPQPYNPEPQRILNTILGFTFTGNFNASAYANITNGYIPSFVPSSLTGQYNRLRPIPTYLTLFGELPTTHPSYSSQTYTADGFCNLVYSSIIKIYCNVIFAGTLDSQNTNNLLGVIPLNCANLGIAFATNYLDTKITKIQNEIYEINIRLEDEYGEPFVVTNNAVSTLLLKMTYKETPAE